MSSADSVFLHSLLEAQGVILSAGTEPARVVEAIMERAQFLTDSSGAVLEVLDGEQLIYGAVSGSMRPFLGQKSSAVENLSGLCSRLQCVLVCDDSESDERVDREASAREGTRSMIVAALPFGNRVIAVLKVVSPRAFSYGPSDVMALEHLSVLMGFALGQARQAMFDKTHNREASELLQQTRGRVEAVLASRSFDVVYQPIFHLGDRREVGFEALARFPTASETTEWWFRAAAKVGLGVEFELALAERALLGLATVPAALYVAVNVSPATLISDGLVQLCRAHPAGRIVVELTEHSAVDDYRELVARTRWLRKNGVRIAVDDAGAGFSSLRHVLHVQPDLIKLDRSITESIDQKPVHQTLVAAMLTFANGTAAALIAEGIETDAELAALSGLGVQFGQGFFLGRPSPLNALPVQAPGNPPVPATPSAENPDSSVSPRSPTSKASAPAREDYYVCGLLTIDAPQDEVERVLRGKCPGVSFKLESNKVDGGPQHKVLLDRSVHVSRDQAGSAWESLKAAAVVIWPGALAALE